MSPFLHVCTAGSCVHPEHVVLANYSARLCTFPAMFAAIEHPREGLVLYDTGYGSHFFEATARFPERLYALVTPVTLRPEQTAVAQLARLGYAPGDVRSIVISHFHADHIAALRDFPRARFKCASLAYLTCATRSRIPALRKGFLPALLPPDFLSRVDFVDGSPRRPLPADCAPFREGLDLLGDGSVLAVPLEGHAAGQLGLMVEAADGRRYFFVADACYAREAYEQERLPHPIAQSIFDDRAGYAATLARLGELHRRSPETLIVPSHCARTLRGLVREGP